MPIQVRHIHYVIAAAADPNAVIPFSDEERSTYAALSARPGGVKAFANHMATSLAWLAEDFEGCFMMVLRSPIPIRSATTPVISLRAPEHPALKLPLPGMTPFMRVLTLNPTTLVCLVVGDFDGHFANRAISLDEARGFNRLFVGQFAYFDGMRHLITGREDLVEDLTWAPYDLLTDEGRKLVFRRRESPHTAL